MATTTQTVMTQLEVAKRTKDNNVIAIAEVLDEMNEILGMAPMVEANLIHSHRFNKRGELPTISLRGPNQASTSSLSRVDPATESMSVFDDFIYIDELNLAGLGNPQALKETEIYAHVEAMSQAFHEQIVYGNPGDSPLEQNGWATRYYVTSQSNVRGLSGTGSDVTSLWLIEWGLRAVHLIYPMGQPSGIFQKNWGELPVGDETNGTKVMWLYQLMLEFGQAVQDDDAVQRLANIESSGTSNNLLASNAMLNLVAAKNDLPKMGRNAVMYVNRDLKTQFDWYAMNHSNVNFTIETLANYDTITRFQGIPIRMVEQILSTETAIS